MSNLRGVFKTMRPKQWTKNVFVFAALVFDGKLFMPDLLLRILAAFVLFCMAASAVYLLNDLVDIEKDRQHPRKRKRPLPAGELSPRFAAVSAGLLAAGSLVGGFALEPWLGGILAIYLVQNWFYSFWLKNVVIIDAMVVSFGFLLRVIAGVVVVHVSNFSPWLYVCSALLTLFISFGKRRHELVLLDGNASGHRAILQEYNLPFLDQIITLITTSMLLAYTLYTFEAQTALASSQRMLLTVPFVFYFVLRYLYLIHVRKQGGAPEELLFEDKPLLLGVVLWGISAIAVIYWPG
jgi:4-hydroxybenzoate polyprenyltransferase